MRYILELSFFHKMTSPIESYRTHQKSCPEGQFRDGRKAGLMFYINTPWHSLDRIKMHLRPTLLSFIFINHGLVIKLFWRSIEFADVYPNPTTSSELPSRVPSYHN